ncbi:MAG: magnesium transporter CorA family protein [Patescibacteria group bacterium]|nr:magnesium transporter CorA family protein [Patescibacteria group bacterium]
MPIEILTNKTQDKKNQRWINVSNAKKKEIEYLKKNFNFNLKNLSASFAHTYSQRTQIEKYPKYLFIILRFPVLDKEKQEIIVSEIDCFVSKNYLITIHDSNLKELVSLFKLCKKDKASLKFYLGKDPIFLLHKILDRSLNQCFATLDYLNIEISKVEEKIFSGNQRESIDDILIIKHNIVNFRRTMQSHRNLLKKLSNNHNKYVKKEHTADYCNLIQSTVDIWNTIENQKEMVEALEYTNDSMLSYRMGDIMKTLTIFSVIMFPLTLLAAIFGMNTIKGMPFVETEGGFWIIMVIMTIGILGMFGCFKRKGWI